MSLTVGGAETFVVDTADVIRAGDNPKVNGVLEVNGVLQTYPVELQAGRILEVDDTLTLTDTRTEYSADVTGTLTVEGGSLTLNDTRQPALDEDTSDGSLFVARVLQATASDSDSISIELDRVRDLVAIANDSDIADAQGFIGTNLSATASDSDSATSELTRTRLLDADATDTDNAQATAERVRFVAADASDSDSAQTVFLATSQSTDPRQATIDLIGGTGGWPDTEPELYLNEEVPHKSKENNADPAIYVHQPTSGPTERFSAEGGTLNEIETVRLDIWVLGNQSEAREYRNRVIDVFQDYMNDNFTRTEFHDVDPQESTDFRHQKVTRQTDHYIYSVEIEFERLVDDF